MRRSCAVGLAATAALSAPLAWGVVSGGRTSPHPRPALRIRGSVAVPLYPGAARPLVLTLVNRRRTVLVVTRVRVRARVDARHRRAGCGRRDFAVRPVPRRAFPVRLRPRGTARVTARVRMRNASRRQDACQGARLRLRYRGWAR